MTKPRKPYRAAIARRSHATQQLPIATCPDCGKRAYTSKSSAKHSARVLYPGQRMRVYACGRWWHLTSQDAARTAEVKDRIAGRPAEYPDGVET